MRRKIITPRLLLRPARVDDAQDVFDNYASDPKVTRYLTWEPHSSIEETREFLKESEEKWERQEAFRFVIIPREHSQRAIGMIGVRLQAISTLGYALSREWWGQGIMTEAVRAVTLATLEDYADFYRVSAFHYVNNPASGRVLLKAGFTYEGVLRSFKQHPNTASKRPDDVMIYSFTRQDLESE